RRGLTYEPVAAHSTWLTRRLALWVRRNPAWTAAVAALLLVGVVSGLALSAWQKHKADIANARAETAGEREQALLREKQFAELQRLRTGARVADWRKGAEGSNPGPPPRPR